MLNSGKNTNTEIQKISCLPLGRRDYYLLKTKTKMRSEALFQQIGNLVYAALQGLSLGSQGID